ncbi:MAG: beta-lactamase family protein [Rubrivivax sp.]|nr:beta-lactamase family protein [Rubrivivax sp.]
MTGPLLPLLAFAGVFSFAASTAWAQPLPVATPDSVGVSAERLNRIESFFADEMGRKRVPGAVVAIARQGKLVYFKAFGQADPVKGVPMSTDTIFQLASMTKIMAAAGALTLTERGQLPLHGRVADHLPAIGTMQVGVPTPDGKFRLEPQKRPVLVHDLFRHTAGMTYGGRPDTTSPIAALWPSGGAAQEMGTSTQFVENLAKLPLVYQPGTVYEYSLSFDVLGAVVEKVSGKPLGGFLAEVLWRPLKMSDTTFRPTEAQMARVARPFPNNPLNGKPQSIRALQKLSTFDCAGACAFGTMGDYLRFGQMLIAGGTLDGVQVLSPATVRLMTSDHLGTAIQNNVAGVEPHRAGYGFGLGVAVRLQPGLAAIPGSPGEFSWNGANGTGFFADPKEQLVVAFGTAAPGELRKYYREQLQNLVYGALSR